MEKEFLIEIRELKSILAQLVGTSDLPSRERFSKVALAKAAKEFKNLSIERGEWVKDYDISKHIRNAGYRAGAFIRTEFAFSNYFKKGRVYYYNRKDLITLGKELKQRNVDLSRYIELKEDQAKFKKYLAAAFDNNKQKTKKKSYNIPEYVKDIITSSPKAPSPDIIRENIKALKEEFFHLKLADYVDIYKDNYAMMKYAYHFNKSLALGLKRKSRKCCKDFNYTYNALELITKKQIV
jgi:hypothetical protein